MFFFNFMTRYNIVFFGYGYGYGYGYYGYGYSVYSLLFRESRRYDDYEYYIRGGDRDISFFREKFYDRDLRSGYYERSDYNRMSFRDYDRRDYSGEMYELRRDDRYFYRKEYEYFDTREVYGLLIRNFKYFMK